MIVTVRQVWTCLLYTSTVQLLSLPDSTMVVGNVTNNNGVFSIAARPGKYVLKISFVGYLTQEKSLQLTAGKPSVNIGTVTLPTDAITVSYTHLDVYKRQGMNRHPDLKKTSVSILTTKITMRC